MKQNTKPTKEKTQSTVYIPLCLFFFFFWSFMILTFLKNTLPPFLVEHFSFGACLMFPHYQSQVMHCFEDSLLKNKQSILN